MEIINIIQPYVILAVVTSVAFKFILWLSQRLGDYFLDKRDERLRNNLNK